jgi:hypothetical protein
MKLILEISVARGGRRMNWIVPVFSLGAAQPRVEG